MGEGYLTPMTVHPPSWAPASLWLVRPSRNTTSVTGTAVAIEVRVHIHIQPIFTGHLEPAGPPLPAPACLEAAFEKDFYWGG